MLWTMEGGFSFPFGGDPEDLLRGLREFAEQQAATVHETQREQFATLTLNTAVELTGAALSQLQPAGTAEEPDQVGAHPQLAAGRGQVSAGHRRLRLLGGSGRAGS